MRGSLVLNADSQGQPHVNASGFQAFINASHSKGVDPHAIQSWTIEQNARHFDSVFGQAGGRGRFLAAPEDKVSRKDSASDGYHLARQLEYIHAEVMRTPKPRMTGLELFPIFGGVAPGARTHTVRRINDAGEATVFRGGNMGIPRVGLTQQEEEFPVRHYVSSYAYDVFEESSSNYARTSLLTEKATTSRDVISRLMNKMTWFGSETHGIYGVLNYPWLSKKVGAVPFTAATDAQDMLDELNALANFPAEQSDDVFSPDMMVMPSAIYHVISQKRLSVSPDGSAITVLKFFLENSPFIKRIEIAPELRGAGPGGTHGILVCRSDAYGVQNVIVQGPTPLPVQTQAFESVIYMYASHGGVIMRDVGNNALLWAEGGE